MLNIDIVGKFFLDLCGEEDYSPWRDLIKLCASEIEGMLRRGVSAQEAGDRLCYAAAALAFYRYCLKLSAGGITDFKAGDVSIGMGGNVDAALEIYREALRSVKGYISPDDFAFICV